MTNFLNTPEALLGRNDSKNPSTTCRGITSSGRPCRRSLAAARTTLSPRRRNSLEVALKGVVAVVEENGKIAEADFYCWQHKDQAEERVQQETFKNAMGKARRKKSAELVPLQERNSIDTLVQRLGIDDVNDADEQRRSRRSGKTNSDPRPPERTERKDFAHSANQRPSSFPGYGATSAPQQPYRRDAGRNNQNRPGFWASFCCANSHEDDYVEVVRHRKRVEQAKRTSHAEMASTSHPPKPSHGHRPQSVAVPQGRYVPNSAARPTSYPRTSSNPQTTHLMSLIPQYCSPQTTSSLLSELIKPISPADEDGYIYIFWLTPQDRVAPAESTARSLLAPAERRPEHARRISDVMTEYSYSGSDELQSPCEASDGRGSKRVMLKIGRANNVTRRMHEWERQCGYKLNLVRWYPYIPSSNVPLPQSSPSKEHPYPDLSRPPSSRRQSDVVRKVPFVKRVERLIHLELAEQRVKRKCSTCGKEHREWFEVEASQDGVRAVDGCVRRWVAWAERQAGV